MTQDSTALVSALRRSPLLKHGADLLGGARVVARNTLPAAGAVTAVGAGTDWDPAAMTAAGLGTYALGHPLAGLANRGMKSRATGLADNAGALVRQRDAVQGVAGTTPKPFVDAPMPTKRQQRRDPAAAKAIADANATGRADAAGARADHRRAQQELPGAQAEATAASRKADIATQVSKGVATAAPYAAAGVGTTVGMTDTGQAVGNKLNEVTSTAGSKVKSVFTGEPGTDWLQIAKDYAPAAIGVGAVGALALWLMSRDDDEPEAKTAAVADDDRVARAARNRRRIEGLLARNPRALDKLTSHTQVP